MNVDYWLPTMMNPGQASQKVMLAFHILFIVAVLEDSLLGGGSCLQGRYKGGDIIAPLYFSILLSCSSPEVSVSDNSP